MSTVAVYKTDVENGSEAETIADTIRRQLPGSDPSFDLEDCDRVLRVESRNGTIDEAKIIGILNKYGYQIDPLL